MKKHLLPTLILQLVMIAAYAQIPNASFEDWTGGNPDHWFSGNYPQSIFVTEVNTAHAGSSAARNDVITYGPYSISSPLLLGDYGQGTTVSSAPYAIHGWYIFNSVGGDYFQGFAVVLDNTGYGTGAGVSNPLGSTSVYTEFSINMYYSSGIPNGDSLLMIFTISNDTSSSDHFGSYFILDDLSYGFPTSIDDASSQATALESICPNPSSDDAQIVYNIKSPGNTALNIYDATGRLVKSLVNQVQSQGRYKAIADVSDLPSGTYICKLSCNERTDVQKLIVQH
ncbi:MAG TPA: T9SS type A sorting domain-containing protein [Chitinophagales bacterium]|nr:T9SS type A sorting domain-containing protein [Chitinophagales bacterium]